MWEVGKTKSFLLKVTSEIMCNQHRQTHYLWKEDWQDDKADPVDNAGKLESIGNCKEKKEN